MGKFVLKLVQILPTLEAKMTRILTILGLILSLNQPSFAAKPGFNDAVTEAAADAWIDGRLHLSPKMQKDFDCLSKAIFYEARGEDLTGKTLVANVVMNRVKSTAWSTTICKVVYQPHQFTWTKNKKRKVMSFRQTTRANIATERLAIKETAYVALQQLIWNQAPITKANHFCEGCSWDSMKLLRKHGPHKFYYDEKKDG